jgi:hypothetical protein
MLSSIAQMSPGDVESLTAKTNAMSLGEVQTYSNEDFNPSFPSAMQILGQPSLQLFYFAGELRVSNKSFLTIRSHC